MDIEKRLALSFYQTIATLNEEHKIYLVQHSQTGKIYVKKTLNVYNKSLYESMLAHPISGTPQIFEIYEDDSALTIIEEYVTGRTLAEMLDSGHRFTDTQIVDIVVKLCDILSELHSFKPPIIHRDIKPSNVIYTAKEDIYLLDFNAAKHETHDKEEDTTLLGTKGYAAPEQYGFGVSNPQTDIYAIGMLMNTLIRGEFSAYVIEGHEFSPIIKKCVELRPSDRYSSVTEVKRILLKGKTSKSKPEAKAQHNWQSFLPPGFRTFNILKMMLSLGVYLFLAWLCLTLKAKDVTGFRLEYERIGLLIFFYLIIFMFFNYRGVTDRFFLCNSEKLYVRVFGRILITIVVSAIYFFLFLTSVCIII